MIFFSILNPDMLRSLQNELHKNNPFVYVFMNAEEQAKNMSNIDDMCLYLIIRI